MAATQIAQRQIQNGAIADAQVAAGAAIASSKLFDGANWIKKDGSVAMTGALNMGSQLISFLQTPSAGTDAATKAYVDLQITNLNSIFDSKPSAKAASTANVTVANPGTAVFDGTTLSALDLLLLKNQTTPAENGLYVFNTSGTALTRHTSMDAWTEVPGAFLAVETGSVNADTLWLCTSDQGGTLGTTAITWFQIPFGGLAISNFVKREVPSGALNGSNTAYVLANTPVSATEEVFLNGLLQFVGAGNDYTISTTTITMLTAPLATDRIAVNYNK